MALSSFQLFVSQAQNGSTELKLQVIRVIFDLLFMYDQDFFGHSEDIVRSLATPASIGSQPKYKIQG
jgi:condensin complex subunit 3